MRCGEVCAREGSVQKIRPIQNLNNINTYRSIASNNMAEKKQEVVYHGPGIILSQGWGTNLAYWLK